MASSTSGTGATRLAIFVALAIPTPAAQEGPWDAVEIPFPERGTPRIFERPGSELVADGTRLLRRRAGRETELACTDRGGTGQIRDLALDPAGAVFIAAERGLFVVSPEVDALELVLPWDGAPKGSPRSVFVDRERRVWIATDEELGAIDPCFGWGRTLSRDDGLPGGPPYRLAGAQSDALVVETAHGTFRYHPDRGATPIVTSLLVDGRTWSSGETLRGTYGDPLHVSAEGRANGGATFRYRLDRHHVWYELGVEEIEGLSPGSHVLDVIAVDRDRRRSAPASIKIEYALPTQYDKAFVVRAALLLIALVSGLFLWRAHRLGGDRRAWVRAPVSAAIAIAIVVQVLAGIVPHAKGWPFIGFSMYTNTYEKGSIIYDPSVVGIDSSGEARKLDYHGVVPFIDDRWQVIWPIIDGGPAVSREWIERYNALHPNARIAGLQARADRRRLTPHGAVRVAPLILSSHMEGVEDGGR